MNERNFQSKETVFKGNYQKRLYQTLRWSYRPFRRRIALLLVVGFLGRLSLLFNTNLMGYWVDTFCQGPNCHALPSFFRAWSLNDYLETSLFLCALSFFLVLFFRVGFSRLSAKAISRIYDEVTYRTSRFPISFFDSHPVGRIMTRFGSDYGNLFRLFGGPLAEFIAMIFDILVMLILITLASPFYLIPVLGVGSFNYWIHRHNKNRLREERRILSRQRSPSIAHFAESAHGSSSIRTYLRQGEFTRRFEKLDELFLHQKLKTFKTLTLFSIQINSLTALLFLVTGFSSLVLLHFHLVSVGSIGVAFTFITLSGNTIQSFFEWLTQLDEALVGGERLDHYLHLPMEPGETLPSHSEFPKEETPSAASDFSWDSLSPELLDGSLQFKNVYFRYRPSFPMVLQDVSFEIQKGQRVGIIGRTGSGKSTLIQALCYLYPMAEGTISINGKTPYLDRTRPPLSTEVSLESFRRCMSLIPQDPVLFRATLRENLTMDESLPDEDLKMVLERVGLGEWLRHLPEGLQASIEERGRNLSAGERQLLCMARCLIQKSPIIIMDEATSSVDPESERIMVEATENFFAGRTQLIIAHRLSTLEKCDLILWLHQGRVYRMGRPGEILPEFIQQHKNEVII